MENPRSSRSDYQIDKELLRYGNGSTFSALRRSDRKPVLLKLVSGADEAELLEQEYALLQGIALECVLPAVGLENIDGATALVCEDLGGYFLSSQLKEEAMSVPDFLDLALAITESLQQLHQTGIVHRGIQPSCLYVDPYASKIRLAGFEHATRLPRTSQWVAPHRISDGSLAYLAPEQTGRMNRPVDARTDLYSLGVVFYRLLTGRLPFRSENPLELVHGHIARQPEPPDVYSSNTPPVVAALVMKLLAKAAEDRYLSASGLAADLRRCRDDLHTLGKIADFPLGEGDPVEHLEIPERLYGREEAIAQLLAAFERIRAGGVELLAVSGYAGIGKTSLVLEVQKPILQARGYFAAGKFDQLTRDEPYSALIQALTELVRQLLTEDNDAIQKWRHRIARALGSSAQVILDVVPDLELIIGPQPGVSELGPMESRNRLELQFQRLITALAGRNHPLVLFLDDLQWADTASLNLMVSLLAHGGPESFLLIGAYRDNEVGADHPLIAALKDLTGLGGRLSYCLLGPLQTEHVEAMLGNTLGKPPETVRALATLVQEKTLGNPFFARTFLETAFAQGLLEYARGEGWRWDTDEIRRAQPTDNVVDLLATRIDQLPADSRDVLELAACVGNRFDVTTLATVLGGGVEAIHGSLLPPLREGLIEARRQGRYNFYHDRIQEAAYRRIPAGERAPLHYRIGTLLLQTTAADLVGERLFEITDHLNQALRLVHGDKKRRSFADLNLQAGNRARQSAAFEAALRYYDYGIQVLGSDCWLGSYELAFALHIGRAEVAFLCGRMDAAEADTALLLEQARSDLERGEVYAIKMVQYETQGRFTDAVAAGKSALGLFGIHFPPDAHSAEQAIDAAVADLRLRVAGQSVQALLELPDMAQAEIRMSMRLLMILWPSAYISGDKPLTVLIAARMVMLSLEHGNTPESAYGYVTHAITLGALVRDYASAYEFGRLALDVNRRFDDLRSRAKVNHMFSCYIGFWSRPISESFAYSREAYSSGLESGDFVYAAYGCFHESWHALFSGKNLQQYYQDYAEKLGFLERTGNRSFYDAHQLMLHWGKSLQGRTKELGDLSAEQFDELAYLQQYGKVDFFIAFHHIAKLSLLYTFGDYAGGRAMARQAEAVALGIRGMIWDAWLCFYSALTLTARGQGLPALTRKEQQRLDELINLMALWAESSPQNFAHQHRLLQAERAVLRDQVADAIDGYEAAIAGATSAGFLHHQALAKERYGEFWLQRGNHRLARFYLTDALADYASWGADAKVRQMAQHHTALLGDTAHRALSGSPDQSAATDALDYATIIGATRTLSEEVNSGRLVEVLLRLLTQTAGARRAILFSSDERGLGPVLEAQVSPEGVSVRPPDVRNWRKRVEAKVVNYVEHTRRSLTVADATQDKRLSASPPAGGKPPRSILCVPVLSQTDLEGMVYLENDLVNDAFTPARLELVETLAAQAAISLKNARLFEGLRREAEQRYKAEQRLREVAAGTAAAVGDSFFRELVLHLSRAMDVRIAFVTECVGPAPRSVRALAFIDNGQYLDDVAYELEGTPCMHVIQGSVCFYPDRLEQHFPKEAGLTSYLGVPMYGVNGAVVGHLAVVDDKPMENRGDNETLLQIFAVRAGAELERQRAQAEAERSQRILAERERLASIGEFASMIAHEIRSPLSTIALALDYLQGDSLSEKAMKRIRLASLEKDRLQSLLSEILLFAKPHVLRREPIDLDTLIRDTIRSQDEAPEAERREIEYQGPGQPVYASGDRDKLMQVLINLLSNARQAISQEERVILALCAMPEAGRLEIEVRNPGRIPDEILEKLTEPFFTTKPQGTGLGLAIVKRILDAHEGQLEICSDAASGVCVRIALPIDAEGLTASRAGHAATSLAASSRV